MDLGASGAHYTLDSISASVSLSPKLDHLRSMWTFILYLCFILLGKPNIYVVYKPVVDTKNNSFGFRSESTVENLRIKFASQGFQQSPTVLVYTCLGEHAEYPRRTLHRLPFLLFVFFVVCLRRSARAFGLTSSINLLCYCALPRNLRVATLLSLLLNT